MEVALSLSQAADKFLEYMRLRRSASDATMVTYKSALKCFTDFHSGLALHSITLKHIDDYADYLGSLGLKPKTFRNKLTIVRSFVRFLYIRDLIDIKPEKIELPSVKQTEANFLDDDEVEKLLSVISDARDRALVLFLIRSGLRASELINLRVDDIFKRSVLVRNGKGGKPRVTRITNDAQEAIDAYMKKAVKSIYLFPNGNGGKISRQYICRIITAYAKKAGIRKKVSTHTLRHTFATCLLMRGARVEDVQPLMGHANMRTTMIYMHFTNPYLAERYDKIMNG